jgi:L-lysine 2,3-aminomutase
MGREYQRTLMSSYRRLFRYYLKVAHQTNPDDAAFDLPDMRFESRLTRYLRQALMRINDPKRPIKNQVVLTPEEVSALTALSETSRRLREFEAQTQLYDFLESSTFSYKPIAALAKYMTNPRP